MFRPHLSSGSSGPTGTAAAAAKLKSHSPHWSQDLAQAEGRAEDHDDRPFPPPPAVDPGPRSREIHGSSPPTELVARQNAWPFLARVPDAGQSTTAPRLPHMVPPVDSETGSSVATPQPATRPQMPSHSKSLPSLSVAPPHTLTHEGGPVYWVAGQWRGGLGGQTACRLRKWLPTANLCGIKPLWIKAEAGILPSTKQ